MSHPDKYKFVKAPIGHPRANKNGMIREHLLIADKIIGKIFKYPHIVHHRDKDGWNNENSNIILCENDEYHNFIELREKAYRATGDANKRQCSICKIFDSIDNMKYKLRYRKSIGSGWYRHMACHAKYEKERRHESVS